MCKEKIQRQRKTSQYKTKDALAIGAFALIASPASVGVTLSFSDLNMVDSKE
ncbi:hypothetical protein [Methanohalophilus mahii]|uniref:hypothetical protein n=1 Tax=Methanohalophilus mahii TaxID=2176 RepID=UPI0012F63666|nr:hypothetical protein [Methanohalophilus mahii]